MKKLATVIAILLLTFSACSKGEKQSASAAEKATDVKLSGTYKEAADLLNEYADIQEDYLDGIAKVNSADDLVTVLKAYSVSMTKVMPKMIEFSKKYPDLDKDTPKELEKLTSRVESLSERVQAETPTILMKYSSDTKVQAAFMEMSAAMSGIIETDSESESETE